MPGAYEVDDHIITYSSTNLLTKDPQKSNFHTGTPLKGMQSSYFYVTDFSILQLPDIIAHANRAFIKKRNKIGYTV